MSDLDDDLDNEYDEQPDEPKPNWRRDLERKAKKADEHAQAAQTAQRELAFYKAGIPMQDPRMSYFLKAYDGSNDPDIIRKACQDAGFMQPEQQDTAAEDEVAQQQQISQASAGASVAGKLTQSDVLALAQKAADAAPRGNEAVAYMAVLREHGLDRMKQAPAQ